MPSDLNPYDLYFHTIPERKPDALSGSAFAASIRTLPLGQVREDVFIAQLCSGNVPEFMRQPRNITIVSGNDSLTYSVLPDYLCLGSNDDYFRTPLNPRTAQIVADNFSCTLPTRKMVNQIWQHADIKLPPSPLPPGAKMSTVPYFTRHDSIVQSQLKKRNAELGLLIAGHKKDVVVSNALLRYPRNVVIYGWHQSNGTVIQGLNPKSHDNNFSDYSHGIRLILRSVLFNGELMDILDIFKHPILHSLLSDEGPLKVVRYLQGESLGARLSWRQGFQERVRSVESVLSLSSAEDVPTPMADGDE